jgi:hypothetical protein
MDDTKRGREAYIITGYSNVYAELGIHQADQTKLTNQPLTSRQDLRRTKNHTDTVRYPP